MVGSVSQGWYKLVPILRKNEAAPSQLYMVSIVLPSNPSEQCETSLAFNRMQGMQTRRLSSQCMRYAQLRHRCSDSHSGLGIFGAQRPYPLNIVNFRPSAPRPALLGVRRFAKPHGHPTYPPWECRSTNTPLLSDANGVVILSSEALTFPFLCRIGNIDAAYDSKAFDSHNRHV
jgi:hypothetical protein